MKKLLTRIFPYDKLLHFVGGTYIALFLSGFTWWVTLLAVLVGAIGVEVYDKRGKGNAEILDIIYTLAGGVAVIIIKTTL